MKQLRVKKDKDLRLLSNYGFTYTYFEDWHIYLNNIMISVGDDRELVISLIDEDDLCNEVELDDLMRLIFNLTIIDLLELG